MMLYLVFFDLIRADFSPRGYKIRCFLVGQCCLIVKETKLEISDPELLHQPVKLLG